MVLIDWRAFLLLLSILLCLTGARSLSISSRSLSSNRLNLLLDLRGLSVEPSVVARSLSDGLGTGEASTSPNGDAVDGCIVGTKEKSRLELYASGESRWGVGEDGAAGGAGGVYSVKEDADGEAVMCALAELRLGRGRMLIVDEGKSRVGDAAPSLDILDLIVGVPFDDASVGVTCSDKRHLFPIVTRLTRSDYEGFGKLASTESGLLVPKGDEEADPEVLRKQQRMCKKAVILPYDEVLWRTAFELMDGLRG